MQHIYRPWGVITTALCIDWPTLCNSVPLHYDHSTIAICNWTFGVKILVQPVVSYKTTCKLQHSANLTHYKVIILDLLSLSLGFLLLLQFSTLCCLLEHGDGQSKVLGSPSMLNSAVIRQQLYPACPINHLPLSLTHSKYL